MSNEIEKITDDDFSGTVLDGGKPSVVDFWATWCAPCRRLDGILEDMARAYEGKIAFYKVDVSESNGTAARYAVRSIPTLLFFQDGEVVDQAVGAISREDIEDKIRRLLGAA